MRSVFFNPCCLKNGAPLFAIYSIKCPQCTDKYNEKKKIDSNFPSPFFDVLKASNFTSGGVQNRETKHRRPGTIVTSFQDSKLPEKQISPTFSYFPINNTLLYHFLANWLARKYSTSSCNKRLNTTRPIDEFPSIFYTYIYHLEILYLY